MGDLSAGTSQRGLPLVYMPAEIGRGLLVRPWLAGERKQFAEPLGGERPPVDRCRYPSHRYSMESPGEAVGAASARVPAVAGPLTIRPWRANTAG